MLVGWSRTLSVSKICRKLCYKERKKKNEKIHSIVAYETDVPRLRVYDSVLLFWHVCLILFYSRLIVPTVRNIFFDTLYFFVRYYRVVWFFCFYFARTV